MGASSFASPHASGWAAKGVPTPPTRRPSLSWVSPDDLSGTEVAHILFSYDEATAAARGEAAKKLIGVGASPAKEQLALAAPADDADAGGADADAAAATGGGAWRRRSTWASAARRRRPTTRRR